MTARRLGTLLLLAVVGLAGGFGIAAVLADDSPRRIEDAAPVVASSPSMPSNPEIKVLDDPDTPALAPNLPNHTEKVGIRPFLVKLPVPDDWSRTSPASGEWRWYPPAQPLRNTFFLRVRQVGNRYQPVTAALEERIADLEGAEDVRGFELESRSDDTFIASYVAGSYRRVAVEAFVDVDDNDTADLWLAVVGRERDRTGLSDLLGTIKDGVVSAS